MNTFSYIVHKLNACSDEQYHFDLTNLSINNKSAYFAIDVTNTIKRTNGFTRCTLIQKMIFDLHVSLHNSPNKNKMHKYDFIRMICRLEFINMDDKTHILNLHMRAQRHYISLCRLAFIFKFKRAPLIIATDLYLSNIKDDERNVITVFQNKQRYLFTITDLNKIIDTALCNSPYYISEPLPVKNPYNNMPFSKSDLYNIYFQIRDRLIKTPPVIYQFFLSNFNLSKFQQNNRCLIREKYIEQFLVNEDKDTLVSYIHSTLSYNNNILIDNNFPNDILIRVFKPYLRLYIMMSYSLDISVRRVAKANLVNKLKQFYIYNPLFGRKMVSITKDNKKRTISYNDKHIPFELPKTREPDFLKSHLSIQNGRFSNNAADEDDYLSLHHDTSDEYDTDTDTDADPAEISAILIRNNADAVIAEISAIEIRNNSMEVDNTNSHIISSEECDIIDIINDNAIINIDNDDDNEFRTQILNNIHTSEPHLTVDELMTSLFPQEASSIQLTAIVRLPRNIEYIDVDFDEDEEDEYDP